MSGSGSAGFVVFVPFVVIPTLTPTLNLTLNPTPPSTFQRTTFNLQPPQLTPPQRSKDDKSLSAQER